MTACHRLLVLAVLAVAIAGPVLAASPPDAEVTFDFGAVVQGATAEHEFTLRNDSDRPLRIAGVRLTPPLSLARMPAVVAPGAEAHLKVRLDTQRVEGPFQGSLLVHFDSGVEAREYVIAAIVRAPIEVRPHAAFFISTPKGTVRSDSLEIVNRESKPLQLALKSPPVPDYEVGLEPIEVGHRYRLTLTVPATAKPGRSSGRLELETSSALKPLLPIGVNIIVRERVYTFPDSVDLGRIKAGDLRRSGAASAGYAQTLMVYQTGGKGFAVQASSDVPGLRLAVEPGPAGDRVQLTVSLAADNLRPGSLAGSVLLQTNDLEFPEIRVPLTGVILAD